jgi:DMSO reductase anchor subunit
MHPAPSIIVFTTLSGLGFGLMAWLGATLEGTVLQAALALALASAGLLASLLHLGQPTRFLKAFSQWRSSWLSREAVLAVATLGLFTLFALAWVAGFRTRLLGGPGALLALATIGATAMIYAQMRSVPRWRSAVTPVLFLLFGLAGGGLLAGDRGPWLLGALGLAQVAAWLHGDRRFARAGTSLETATGIGALGRPRLLAPPHTGPNYLLREMVFVVGRDHAVKLRVIGLLFAVVLPLALVAVAAPAGVVLAAASHVAGTLVLRWLFFAEAEHVVGLYYGRHQPGVARGPTGEGPARW